MSTLKSDAVTAVSSNTSITIKGAGSGVVKLGDGELTFPDADGDANQVIKTNGSGALSFVTSGFTLATEQATTSGTSVTFGSIPTGTKLIIIMFEDVSMNSGADFDVTIGDSGGLETSGYVSSSARMEATAFDMNNSTADFIVKVTDANTIVSGTFTLALKDASNFTWVASYLCKSATNKLSLGGGHKSLSAELTQVAISGGTFDNGSINIMYQ